MSKAIKYNLKVLFGRKEFYIAVSIMLFLVTLHTGMNIFTRWFTLHEYGYTETSGIFIEFMRPYAYQLSLSNLDVGFKYIIMLIFPLLGTMIYSDSYVIEMKNKIVNYMYVRLKIKNDYLAKIIVIFGVTFLTVLFVLLFEAIVNAFIYQTDHTSDVYLNHIYELSNKNETFLDQLRVFNIHLYVFYNLVRFSLVTSILSVGAFILSLFVNNRLVVCFSPVVLLLIDQLILSTLGIIKFTILSAMDFYMDLQFYHYLVSVGILLLFIIGGYLYKVKVAGDTL